MQHALAGMNKVLFIPPVFHLFNESSRDNIPDVCFGRRDCNIQQNERDELDGCMIVCFYLTEKNNTLPCLPGMKR